MIILYSILSWIDWVVYNLAGTMFRIIIEIGNAEFFTSDQIKNIADRVYVVVGVLMLFKLVIAGVQYLINPDVFEKVDPNHILRVNKDNTILVDIKGTYNDYGGDRIYKIHEKMMYYFFKLHLNKVVPEEYFKAIRIAPDRIRWMKNRKTPTLRKSYINTQSVEEFCKRANNGTNNLNNTTINIPGLPCF